MAFFSVPKIKVLVTRVREESLSGKLVEMLKDVEMVECHALPDNWDITELSTYPTNLGDFDIVYNCSGITLNEAVYQHNPINAQRVYNVNVIGAMNLTTEYAKQRSAKHLEGCIVHVGSTGSRKVFTNCSAYCSSKAALAHYVQCAGYELRSSGISVIGIHPGNIKDTQMTKNVQLDLQNNRGMSAEQVDKIYSEAHDPYEVASFLASMIGVPHKDVTGENFYLGQGWKG
jgi:NAD(P)-dependent dehydrogenase (short-subunit alcohol dehydrogenase family)